MTKPGNIKKVYGLINMCRTRDFVSILDQVFSFGGIVSKQICRLQMDSEYGSEN